MIKIEQFIYIFDVTMIAVYDQGMMTPELYTRDAAPEDAAEIYDMQYALAAYTGSDLKTFGITVPQIERTICDENSWAKYRVACGESAIRGMMLSSQVGPSFTGKYGVYIEDLYVKPEYRDGQGVGTMLLAHACMRALELAEGDKEKAFVRLDTSKDNNDETINYYLRRKFDGHTINFRLTGDDLVDLSNY